ncbi:hypothetical protein H1R20_g1501, partial [Candolleomyces eurysporus]
MHTSPRKEATTSRHKVAKLVSPTRKHQPARCRQCPGRPLWSECTHGRRSKVSKRRTNDEGSGAQAAIGISQPVGSSIEPSVIQGSPLAHAQLPTLGLFGAPGLNSHPHAPARRSYPTPGGGPPLGSPAGSYMATAKEGALQPSATGGVSPSLRSPEGSYMPGAAAAAFQPAAFAFNPMFHHSFAPNSMFNFNNLYSSQGIPPIDPSLMLSQPPKEPPTLGPPQLSIPPQPIAQSHSPPRPAPPPPPPPVQALAHENTIASDRKEDSDQVVLSDEESDWGQDTADVVVETTGTSTSTGKTKKKRIYPSDKNPFFGVIEGVGRGNTLLKMARRRKLKSIYTAQEDVSNRTASWLYVAMHNPGATQPFTHFASRRLRLEAPDDLQKIHKQVLSLMTVLKWADRSHSFQSQKEKEEAIHQLKEATERAEVAVSKAADTELENQQLREQLRLAQGGSPQST